MKPKVAVIGCGIWGKNLVRNFNNLGVLDLVCDLDKENLNTIKNDYIDIETTNNLDEVLLSNDINMVVIATPSHTHYPLVKTALEYDKHVYVEKPIATTAKEAFELKQLAEKKGLVLMVGHLLLYHPAVNRLRGLIKDECLGKIKYIQSDRLNINYFRNDRSVMWDLAPHDLSMISYVLDKNPLEVVSARGCATNNDNIMDMVHLDIDFPDGIKAHISTSWIHPEKRVLLLVRGTKATAVFDDTCMSEKLHIYDNFSQSKDCVGYPEYLEIEPLKLECQHFINSVINKIKPRSDGDNGYEIVRILENAEKLMLGKNYQKLHSLKLSSSRKKQ